MPTSIHRKNALILGIALLGAAPFGWGAVASVALGGGIQVLNLRGLERGVQAMVGLAAGGQTGAARALVAVRWVLLLGAVALCLVALPVQPIAFSVGLSVIVPTVIWHGLETARSPEGS